MYKVPYGLDVSVDVVREGNTARVVIHAPMYQRKTWSPTFCYSTAFTDAEILRDHSLNTKLTEAYGPAGS